MSAWWILLNKHNPESDRAPKIRSWQIDDQLGISKSDLTQYEFNLYNLTHVLYEVTGQINRLGKKRRRRVDMHTHLNGPY